MMELLLNLIWISLGLAALFGFLRGRRVSSRISQVPYRKSVFALACGLILLFPVVSESDDLHPTQAVLEEASKRVQLGAAPLHLLPASPPLFLLATTLALCLAASLVFLQLLDPPALQTRLLVVSTAPSAGRAPPLYCR